MLVARSTPQQEAEESSLGGTVHVCPRASIVGFIMSRAREETITTVANYASSLHVPRRASRAAPMIVVATAVRMRV